MFSPNFRFIAEKIPSVPGHRIPHGFPFARFSWPNRWGSRTARGS